MNLRLMSDPRGADASAPADEVRAQIERILGSQTLSGSDQLKRFLRLVVERTLNGQPELLKEYNLGLEVFQRPPDYDPKVDPIVRVQARRLRSKLVEYYAGEGAHDPVVIQIPKGAYVPVFDARNAAAPAQDTKSRRHRVWLAGAGIGVLAVILAVAWLTRDGVAVPADAYRSIAVLPLQMFTESGSRGHIASQIAEVLTTELAKNTQLRVLSRTTATKYRETSSSLPEIARALGVRWVVEGGVGVQGNRVYVKLRAVDSRTDRKVWADVFDCDLSELVAVNARAADRIAAAIVLELRSSHR
jgi:TolB-like protein